MVNSSNTTPKKHGAVQLLQFDNNQKKIIKNGRCKLIVNLIKQNLRMQFCNKKLNFRSKAIHVVLKANIFGKTNFPPAQSIHYCFSGIKLVCVPFKDTSFFVKQNVIFIETLSTTKMMLLFGDETLAEKVFKVFQKSKYVKEEIEEVKVKAKLLPYLQKVANNNEDIVKILSELFDTNDVANISIQIEENSVEAAENDSSRKRRHSKQETDLKNQKKTTKLKTPRIAHPKRSQKTVLKKPAYEIIKKRSFGSASKKIIVFNAKDKSLCHEYYLYKKEFCCDGCREIRLIRKAEIRNYGKNSECIEINSGKHECQFRPYDPEKFLPQTKIVKKPFYECAMVEKKEILIIFPFENRKLCYRYFPFKKSEFRCEECRKLRIQRFAKFQDRDTENESIELNNDLHLCQPIEYLPLTSTQNSNIYKPDYEIIEESGDKSVKHLIIFDVTNREVCYEFRALKLSLFCCLGCSRFKKTTTVNIFNYQKDDEYVKYKNSANAHVCQPRPYNPQKFIFSQKVNIHKPDFEIQVTIINGKETKKIFVFDKTDQKRSYGYHSTNSKFICAECLRKGKYNYANLLVDKTGIEYLQVHGDPHVCEPLLHISEKEIRFDSTQFEIFNPTFDSQNFIVFHPTDRKFCYRFRNHHGYYACAGCAEKNRYLLAKLHHSDENGNSHVTIKAESKHICEPQKYDASKMLKITTIAKSQFILYRSKDPLKRGMLRFILFTNEKKEWCYDFRKGFDSSPVFKCSKCSTLQKTVSAKLCQNSDGEEYLKILSTKHFCKPIKYSTIKSSIKAIVEKYTDFSKHLKFELIDNILTIFHENDETLCYKLQLEPAAKHYLCLNCKKEGTQVTAKFATDNQRNKIVVYGKKKHVCNPIKYKTSEEDDEEEEAAPKFTNFIIPAIDEKVPKILVFTDEKRTHFYKFSKDSNHYFCLACNPMKNIRLKLLTSKTGTKYLELPERQHICTPIPYNPFEFEVSVIPNSRFELFPNTKGIKDSALILFTENSCENGYDFGRDHSTNNFICRRCNNSNIRTVAKLCKNDAHQMQLEIPKLSTHECTDRNLEAFGRLYYPENFKCKIDNENGCQTITTSHPLDKNLSVEFAYDEELKVFYCMKCKEKNRYLAAKICKNFVGKEFLLLAFNHVCFSLL